MDEKEEEIRKELARRICREFYREGVPPAGDGMTERVAQRISGLPFPIEPDSDFINLLKRKYGLG